MELLAELAARFPKNGDPADEKPRLRLLAEDLSETMNALELAAAIKAGKREWKFLPTLAEIVEAGADYRAERRDRAHEAMLQYQARQLLPPPQSLPDDYEPQHGGGEAERAAMIADLHAKLDAGHAKLMGTTDAPAAEPYSWRLMREAGLRVSPQLVAFQAELEARD